MFILSFQASLTRLFPCWETIMRHQLQEVFVFACGLTDKAEELLDFIYMNLKEYILHQTSIPENMFDNEASFLKSLMKEAPEKMKFDPLHNKYINYVKENDTKIFVPSKVYIFGPKIKSQEVELSKQEMTSAPSTAECLMKLKDEDASEVLKILQRIGTFHQKVSISYLDWNKVQLPDNISGLAREALRMSTNITSIGTWTCKIPPRIYEHIVAQLRQCEKLQRLDLGDCKSVEIGKAVAAPTFLRELFLYDCEIKPNVYKEIVQSLQKHNGLEKLRLNHSRGIPAELGYVVSGMNSLKEIYVKECKMGKPVVESVLTGLANCHELQEIQLAVNNLSNCLSKLFPSGHDHPGFPHLNLLFLSKTNLSQEDLLALSCFAGKNKLPQLRKLDLSFSELTGSLKCLLGHPGFPHLQQLVLMKTGLNQEDLTSLCESVNQNWMPELRKLLLDHNDLSTMESQMENLIESCTKRYEKLNLVIQLSFTKLPTTFTSKMRDICSGTVVHILKPLVRKQLEKKEKKQATGVSEAEPDFEKMELAEVSSMLSTK